MKKIAIIIFIVIIKNSYSQVPNWVWAERAGGNAGDGIVSIATDSANNVYACGLFFSNSITFGSTTLVNTGLPDLFIVKYDSNGNVLWAKSAAGTNTGTDRAISVTVDNIGNVYLAGIFDSSTITFGTYTLTNSNAYYDVFLVKYDSNGNVIWANNYADIGIVSVFAEKSGTLLLAGGYVASSTTFGSTTLINNGNVDMYFLKLDSNGNILWAKGDGGSGNDDVTAISSDKNGNIFLTGSFESPLMTIGSSTLINTGQSDIFISKYDNNGNAIWSRSSGGNDFDECRSITIDTLGNACVTGGFSSSSINFGTTTLTNVGNNGDMFVVKYDYNGNIQWAKSAGGIGGSTVDGGRSIAHDASGNIYVVGDFSCTDITFGSTLLTNTGTFNTFVTKYDSYGNIQWAKTTTSANSYNKVSSVFLDKLNNIYVAGEFFSSAISFGSFNLINATNNGTVADTYLAKLSITSNVPNIDLTSKLNIFPNPNHGIFQLKLTNSESIKINIYNTIGEKIYESFNQNEQIDLSNTRKGIYFIEVYSKNNLLVTDKIIISD